MIYLKKFEDIKIPINVGDTILGGRFKNKKVIIKKIGKNAKGDITVNGKPLLKYRLVKESIESFEEETNDLLRSVMDMGMGIETNFHTGSYTTRIYKEIGDDKFSVNAPKFEWDLIRADVQAYIGYMTEEFGYKIEYMYSVVFSDNGIRRLHTEEEIFNDKDLGEIHCFLVSFIV
jgi:hypothetical protein